MDTGRLLWAGRDYTKQSAITLASRLKKEDGKKWYIEPSPYETGRYIVTRPKTEEEMKE